MTFKVGDEVRIIRSSYGDSVVVGSVGTVMDIGGSTYMVSNNDYMDFHDYDDKGNFHLCFWESELELIE